MCSPVSQRCEPVEPADADVMFRVPICPRLPAADEPRYSGKLRKYFCWVTWSTRSPAHSADLASGERRRGALPLDWGAASAALRGPVVASPAEPRHRNAIGSHSGSYAIYRALAVATGALAPDHRPDLTDTAPAASIGPWPQWADPAKIVSLDPYGHLVGEVFAEEIRAGIDARPTIAVTTARIDLPEIRQRIAAGDIVPDGRVVLDSGEIRVTKAAIDPVWHLPGIAARFGVAEPDLRRTLFEETGGMFPELVTRPDLEVFLPPIGGTTVYLFGDVERIGRPRHGDRLPRPRRMQRLGRVRLRHLHLPALSRARGRGVRRRRRRRAASASSSTTGRRAAPSAR